MRRFPRITGPRRRADVGPLLRVPALAQAAPERLAPLVAHTDRLRLPAGSTVAEAGTTARELVVVLTGEAVARHADGSRQVLRAGAEVGGREVLAGGRHATTVVAVTDLDVVVVNGPAVRWAEAEGLARFGPTPAPETARSASPSPTSTATSTSTDRPHAA